MKEKNENPYVHKFSRKYLRPGNDDQTESGITPGLKLAGIIMISCIAVPLLLMGVSLLAGLIQK
jgi:hypothetical protein